MEKLKEHAKLTISTLEKILKNRGLQTRGLRKWEQELLVSAYEAAEIDPKDWKFNLKPGKKIDPVTWNNKC